MEFKVREVIPLAKTGGAGNLVISEVLMIHLHESILDEEGLIDQEKIDLVARLGASWYSRVTPASLFKVDKPLRRMGMGVDRLPEHIRLSHVFISEERSVGKECVSTC